MQLNLFQWDNITVSNGYECLARLDFTDARQHFSKVLKVQPDHLQAGRGMEDLLAWESAFREMQALEQEAVPGFLWNKIKEFPFTNSETHRTLQRSLIKQLLALLHNRATFYLPPDLCSGYLYLQLADHVAAEADLRVLLNRLPENGRLHGYLADALWMQGRREIANAAYARALLLAPHQVSVVAICNHRLAEVIREYGPAMAPVHGFLQGILPLVELPGPAPVTRETRIHELLRQAECARHRGNHAEMVATRRALKRDAPAVLQEYLDRLENGTLGS